MDGFVAVFLVLGMVWASGYVADYIDIEYMQRRSRVVRFVNKTIIAGSVLVMSLGIIFKNMNF